MTKSIETKKLGLIGGKIITRHKQIVSEAKTGHLAHNWQIVGNILEIAGKIICLCTVTLIFAGLSGLHEGLNAFFREMGKGFCKKEEVI